MDLAYAFLRIQKQPGDLCHSQLQPRRRPFNEVEAGVTFPTLRCSGPGLSVEGNLREAS